jgi:hypothetical protein
MSSGPTPPRTVRVVSVGRPRGPQHGEDQRRDRLRTRTAALTLVALAALLVSGCVVFVDRGPRVTLVNDLDRRVQISRVKDGVESSMGNNEGGDILEPGQERGFAFAPRSDSVVGKSCEAAGFVARSDSGEILATITPPICLDDRILLSQWVRADPSSP